MRCYVGFLFIFSFLPTFSGCSGADRHKRTTELAQRGENTGAKYSEDNKTQVQHISSWQVITREGNLTGSHLFRHNKTGNSQLKQKRQKKQHHHIDGASFHREPPLLCYASAKGVRLSARMVLFHQNPTVGFNAWKRCL